MRLPGVSSGASPSPEPLNAADTLSAALPRLDTRRVYVFPSRQGFMLMFAIALMLLGAINYDIGLGYIMSFALTGLGLVCLLHTWRNLLHLGCLGLRGEPVFAGGVASLRLTLDNRGQPARRALDFAHAPGRMGLFRRAGLEAVSCDIPADSLHSVILHCPAPRRGRLAVGRILVETCFPLGLVRAWAWLAPRDDIIVYPRPRGRLPMPRAEGGNRSAGAGQREGDEDFVGFRAYRGGDLPRHIDWKVLARSDNLVVRRFVTGEAAALALGWEAAAPAGAVEARLEQLARWVVDADERGLPWSLSLPGQHIPTGSGEAHLQRCLTALALFGEADT